MAVSLLISGLFLFNSKKSQENTLFVRQNSSIIYQLSNNELKQNGIYEFSFDGGTGSIEVKEGKVRVLPMDKKICPEGICSDTGWIKNSSKIIVCMPNHLVIGFNNTNTSDVDSRLS
jgi:hypothetical protein